MARKPRGLSPEDMAVWADVARTVRPLRRRRQSSAALDETRADVRAEVTETPPQPAPAANAAPSSAPTPIARPRPHGPPVTVQWAPAPTPADRSGERKIRRGQVDIDAVLDLHGYTQDQAFAALTHFLYQAQARGAAAVLVVHGKGGQRAEGESAPGVLRRRLPDWLAAAGLKPIVSGMAPAHRRHGGAGASYVFLRRLRPTDAGD